MSEEIGANVVEDLFAMSTGETRFDVQLRRSIVDDVSKKNSKQRNAVGQNGMIEKDEQTVVRT